METPVFDFVSRYAESGTVRAHMPGHKGKAFLGCEARDITEISGADSLYAASGVIAESEENAARLFGSAATFYSTEGSSHCIRAMLRLAALDAEEKGRAPVVLAARNVHRAFVTACALLGLDAAWLLGGEEDYSLCRCRVEADGVRRAIRAMDAPPAAVYVTSPDYLGGVQDVAALAAAAHEFGVPLVVDGAHGAYLHFLPVPSHPLDLGADMCCDSAHKTLPCLTGAAYLHVAKRAPRFAAGAREALALFGSTSPSYLTLQSLDLANRYMAEGYPEKLLRASRRIAALRREIGGCGWRAEESDPLRVTASALGGGMSGGELAEALRRRGVECEYADPDFAVLMLTPENGEEDMRRIGAAFASVPARAPVSRPELLAGPPVRRLTIRQAMMSPQETADAGKAVGRIMASPAAECPPAVPPVICGEEITERTAEIFAYYGIGKISVVR